MGTVTLRKKLFGQNNQTDVDRNRISPETLPLAKVGTPYNLQLDTFGSVGEVFYEIIGGILPLGLTLSPSGLLSGMPTASGSFVLTIKSTDSDLIPVYVAHTYHFSVEPPTLALSPTTLPAATLGVTYSELVVASGGTAPYTYSLT